MTSLYPVTAGRTSEQLSLTRILSQIQSDQLALLSRQDQISTGRRINAPSEDSQASIRAISLQRILEQKEQFKTNLLTSESYLSASDNSLSDVADLLIAIRGTAVSVAQTTSSDTEREAAAIEVRNAIVQLSDTLNKKFRGRYLFGGTNLAAPPIRLEKGYVVYEGLEGNVRSHADVNLLLDTNVSAHQVVGAIAPEVEGTVDFNPVLTTTSKLADLRGGEGISSGSIEVSDGTNLRIVDISSAETIGDVIRLIESQPPSGTQVHARIVGDHLEVELLGAPGAGLFIQEVGGGTTAAELGILGNTSAQDPILVGQDLDPAVTLTTRLADAFGSRAQAVARSAGQNNNIVLTAKERGDQFNNYRLQFVDDDLLQAAPGLLAGSETATLTTTTVAAQAALTFTGSNNNLVLTANTAGIDFNDVRIEINDAGVIGNAALVGYDPLGKVLTIGVDTNNNTEIQTVINEIGLDGNFTAAYDGSEPVDGGFVPTATVNSGDAGAISGNTGNSGALADTILVNIQAGLSSASSIATVLQANSAVTDLFDVSLDDRDTVNANQAGQNPVDVDALGVTNGGSGLEFDNTSGVQVVNGDEIHELTFASAETVEDILNVFNGSKANVLAEINSARDGINVRSLLSGSDFNIGENGGSTATQLGVRSFVGETKLEDLNHGLGIFPRDGVDFNIRRHDDSELAIDVSGATTIDDVIQLINGHVDNQVAATRVEARLSQFGNGIELLADDPTGSTTLEVLAVSDAAIHLGLIPDGERSVQATAAQAATASLSFPVPNATNTAITVTAGQVGSGLSGYEVVFRDTASGDVATATLDTVNRQLLIDLDQSSTTANTVVNAVNLEGTFSAVLDLSADPTNDGTGLPSSVGVVATTAGGAADLLTGRDTNPLEVKGAFNSLLRLTASLEEFDLVGIGRAIEMLDEDFLRLNFSRAELGVQQQQVDTFRGRLETEKIELTRTLSQEIDVDLAEAISSMLQQQAAYQASLQLMGRTFQLSLLDFL